MTSHLLPRRRAAFAALVPLLAVLVVAAPALPAGATDPVSVDPVSVDPGDEVARHRRLGVPSGVAQADTSGFDTVIVRTRSDAATGRVLDRLAEDGTAPGVVFDEVVDGFVVVADDALVAALRTDPDVVSVDEPATYRASDTQTNPIPGLDRIDQRDRPLSNSYTYHATGVGVTAYVLDGGINETHQEFAGRLAYGAYYPFPGEPEGVDDFCDTDGNGVSNHPTNGHGTHVAATIGGTVHGVAKGVTIVPVKVLDCAGFGDDVSILAGIDFVLDHHAPGVPAVVNMSLGGPPSALLDAAVLAMIADGITVVAAAGNENAPSCGVSPARVPAVLTVGAMMPTDPDGAGPFSADDVATFSNFGPCNDLFAPGVLVQSASHLSDAGTAVKSGTSMAAPHVAGAAAVYLQANPSATPAQVAAAIVGAATTGRLANLGTGDPNRLLFVDPAWSAPPPRFSGLTPARLLDTREDGVTVDGDHQAEGLRFDQETTPFVVAGRGGVPRNASAVVLNVVAVDAIGDGYVTVFPCGATVPLAANLNYVDGQTVPNAVVAGIADDGTVCIFTLTPMDLVVDVTGWFGPGSGYTPLTPARLLDTRPPGDGSTVDGLQLGIGRRNAGQVTEVQVLGRPGVPPSATSVVLNVAAISAGAGGYLTVYPCGTPPPFTANLNVSAGQTVPNAVVAAIGASGRVCVFTSTPVDLAIDLNGALTPATGYTGVIPARLLDTRIGAAVAAGSVTEVQVASTPSVPSGATGAVLNVTVTEPALAGFLTVFPCGSPRPNAASLNFVAGQTVPNAVVTRLGTGGQVCIYSLVTAHVVVDVNGWFA
jgi:subtilisin family serine protease